MFIHHSSSYMEIISSYFYMYSIL